jgi:hypothetical protein
MSKQGKKAMRMLKAARPKSGKQPTAVEWKRMQKANEEFCFAMLADTGSSAHDARSIAKAICGGDAGRLLLSITLGENGHE